jgi:hypothetical protein
MVAPLNLIREGNPVESEPSGPDRSQGLGVDRENHLRKASEGGSDLGIDSGRWHARKCRIL